MINYYKILGVDDFSPIESLKSAFREKARQYHPDLVRTLGPKLVQLAQREMAMINMAYEILGNAGSKADFDASLRDALRLNTLEPCRVCGLQYVPDSEYRASGVCPMCAGMEGGGDDSLALKPPEIRPRELLRACFIAIHHFSSATILHDFKPTVNFIVNGERMKAAGAPGHLELRVQNRRLHDLVRPSAEILKHAWSDKHGAGKIIFTPTHPVECADRLWGFIGRLLGEPQIEYCRVSLNNDNYVAYEHLLNQSVIISIAGLSPWTAAKLYARHQKNLIASLKDPEAAAPENYFSVLTGNAAENAGAAKRETVRKAPPPDLERRLEEAARENRRFEAQLDFLKKDNEELRLRAHRKEAEAQTLTVGKAQFEELLAKQKTVIVGLEVELTALEEKTKTLEAALESRKARVRQQDSLIAQLDRSLDEKEELLRLRALESGRRMEELEQKLYDGMEALRRWTDSTAALARELASIPEFIRPPHDSLSPEDVLNMFHNLVSHVGNAGRKTAAARAGKQKTHSGKKKTTAEIVPFFSAQQTDQAAQNVNNRKA